MNRRRFLTAAAGAALVPAAPAAVVAAPEHELLFVSPPCELISQFAEFEAACLRQIAAAFCIQFEQLRKESAAVVYRQFDAPVRT